MNAPLWIIRIRYALGRWLVAPVVRLPRRMAPSAGHRLWVNVELHARPAKPATHEDLT